MEKLSDHLLEIPPYTIKLQVGKPNFENHIEKIEYNLKVDYFSNSPQKLLEILS